MAWPPSAGSGIDWWNALLVCRSETIRCEWILYQWVGIRSFAHPKSDLFLFCCLVLSVCIYVTWKGNAVRHDVEVGESLVVKLRTTPACESNMLASELGGSKCLPIRACT